MRGVGQIGAGQRIPGCIRHRLIRQIGRIADVVAGIDELRRHRMRIEQVLVLGIDGQIPWRYVLPGSDVSSGFS